VKVPSIDTPNSFTPIRCAAQGLSFYRDRDMAEADLVIEHPYRAKLLEAKSAETASGSLSAGTNRVRAHIATPSKPCDVVVVYAGKQGQSRSYGLLVPWTELDQRKWSD